MTDARQHAHQHAQARTRERRQRLAHEAARLMAEGGIRDFQMAKRKAAQRLGIFDDAHSPVLLHLHSDDADAVPRWLDDQGIPAQARTRRLRLDRERETEVPAWLFGAEGLGFEVLVLPLDGLRQAPLSAIDEKPMRRASAAQLRTLLADD